MVRRVHCQHIVEGGDAEMIPDEQCPDPKPITMRICQMQKSCPEWSESEWSKVKYKHGDSCPLHTIPSLKRDCFTITLGSFSNDDCDGNENVKKATLTTKTTTLHAHYTFSLLLLRD